MFPHETKDEIILAGHIEERGVVHIEDIIDGRRTSTWIHSITAFKHVS